MRGKGQAVHRHVVTRGHASSKAHMLGAMQEPFRMPVALLGVRRRHLSRACSDPSEGCCCTGTAVGQPGQAAKAPEAGAWQARSRSSPGNAAG